jgi:hypothetical protein
MYPVVFFDALRVKIREEAVVRSKAVYLALGVLPDGTRVPRGSLVAYLPYIMGRDDTLWSDAARFDPERFLADGEGAAAAIESKQESQGSQQLDQHPLAHPVESGRRPAGPQGGGAAEHQGNARLPPTIGQELQGGDGGRGQHRQGAQTDRQLNRDLQDTHHEGHHHEAPSDPQQAGGQASDAAHGSKAGQGGVPKLLNTRQGRTGSNREHQHQIHRRLQGQQHTRGEAAALVAEQGAGEGRQQGNHQGWPQGQPSGMQMGPGTARRGGHDGEGAGRQGLMRFQAQQQQQRRKNQAATDPQQWRLAMRQYMAADWYFLALSLSSSMFRL